jgi:hypothetical protein
MTQDIIGNIFDDIIKLLSYLEPPAQNFKVMKVKYIPL